MRRYNPKEIEPKWQEIWEKSSIYKTDMAKTANKYYVIPMLPYTSGDIHIGHWYNFGPTDTVARFHRMQGKNVLQAIGFDAFGLPAENAAIKNKTQPAVWTRNNIKNMTGQLKQIGASYDWSHSLATCDPSYYHWNQWLFLQLYKHKLAYRAKALVNWCPKDKTVLANEQVVGENNVCERCGTPVIQKEMEQWFFKITDYTERLLKDLGDVDWPAKVKTMQENWIGESRGALIDFEVADGNKIQVFTTRPDTIYGATYVVLAPEHPLAEKLATDEQKSQVVEYISKAARKTELERQTGEKQKTGVFTGAYAINPATKEKIPVWIADYVLMSYGTGAIMAVPAHDDRDFDFAQKYQLPVKQVVAERYLHLQNPHRQDKETISRQIAVCIIKHPEEEKYLVVRPKGSDFWSPLIGGIEKGETAESTARREMTEETGYHDIKKLVVNDNVVVSEFFAQHKDVNRIAYGRAVYIELGSLARQAAPQADELAETKWVEAAEMSTGELGAGTDEFFARAHGKSEPYLGEGRLINSGKFDGELSELVREKITKAFGKEHTQFRLRDWLISRQRYWGTPIPIVYCDDCGPQPLGEKDLPVILPEDVEFTPTGRNPLLDRPDFVDTQCPNCKKPAKRETDTMDTFVDSSWYFLRYLDNQNNKAPFSNDIVNQWAPVDHYIGGIEHAILHLLYARFITKFLHDEYGLGFEEPFKKLTNQGIILGPDGLKMSKSRGNVVNPDEQGTSYGADSLRLYLMFMGPYEEGGPYNLGGIAGTRRFLDRLWTLIFEFLEVAKETGGHNLELEVSIRRAVQKAVKKVSQDLEKLSFNTAISALMEAVNELYKLKSDKNFGLAAATWDDSLNVMVQLLAPLAPHIAEELWQELGHETSVHLSSWPTWDEELIEDDFINLAVQVNGKVRSEIAVEAGVSEADAVAAAKADAKIAPLIEGKNIKKAIYVPGRLVSLVI